MRCIFPFFLAAVIFFTGCSKTAERPVHCDNLVTDTLGTGDSAKLFVPTAFSPNNDGLNDVFRPVAFNVTAIDVKIYDNNNNIVFNTHTLGTNWNLAATGNIYKKYYYRIQATTTSNHQIGMCGDLHLVNCIPNSFDKSVLSFEDQLTQNGFTNPTLEYLSARVCN